MKEANINKYIILEREVFISIRLSIEYRRNEGKELILKNL